MRSEKSEYSKGELGMTVKRIVIIPYKMGSQSAKNLKKALFEKTGIKTLLVRKDSTKYQPRWTDYIINWGCSTEWSFLNLHNKYMNQLATDKLRTFQAFEANNKLADEDKVRYPEFTTDKTVVEDWINSKNLTVVARHTLSGHSGAGIALLDKDNTSNGIPTAPLQVQNKKKKNEYRVHVFNDEVIDITQKKKRNGFENVNTTIRNFKNGWVYARDDIFIPEDLEQQAKAAMMAIGLQFGAVDIIWNEKENKCYVLEINTAPGLVGTTLTKYTEAFTKEITYHD